MSTVTRVCDPVVTQAFKLLKEKLLFGFRNKDGLFVVIPSIDIDPSGKLFYLDDKKRRTSVSSLIMNMKELQSARWLDHLHFIDKNANIVSFKKHVITVYGVYFS